MTGWLIAIIVIILLILFFVGLDKGWFKSKDMINGKLELEDYSTIEIKDTDVEVTDSTIQSYLDSIVSHETTTEEVTEGTAEDGDTINLDYSGVLEGEEEPFEGGTAEGASLTLGSGTMIDGFESQIIGHEIGETFDIDVTFPEDYSSEDVAGKNATFTITVNSKTVSHVPELTDELIQEYSAEHLDEQIDTVEDIKEYYRTNLYDNYLESAILNAMVEKSNVVYYNEKDLANMTAYNSNYLSYYASYYGWDADTMAQLYGYETAAEYADSEARKLLQQTMIYDKVADEQGIEITDDEINEVLEEYMENEGYEGTLEEFKEASGEAFLFLVTETEVKQPKVLDFLKDRVKIVEAPKEEAEEAAEDAAEEIAEDAAEAAEEVVEDAAEAAEDAAAEVAEDAAEAAQDIAEKTEDAAENAAEAVEEAAEDAAAEIAEDAAEVAEDAAEAAEEVAEDAAEAVRDATDAD